MHDLEAAFGAPVLEAYGMTEAAHQMASNPLPPAARKPGSVGPRHRRAHQHHGRATGSICRPGERGEVVIQGPNVITRLREQSRGERDVVRRRLVPHRRSGLPGRRRLPDARRPHQGADQPRRREDLAARDRRSAARASGGRRGGVLRRAAPDLGRGGRRRRRRCSERGDRGRAAGVLQGAAGRLQASEADSHHRRHPAHGHRQDSAPRRGARRTRSKPS